MLIEAVLLAAATPANAPAAITTGITAAMTDSAAGWNAGDLDRFMAAYADDALYVTGTGLVRGRAAIAAHYRPRFVDGRNTRGRLSFRMLGDRRIDAAHHVLFARWTLDTGPKSVSGMTTLVFERRAREWRIVVDHSS